MTLKNVAKISAIYMLSVVLAGVGSDVISQVMPHGGDVAIASVR